MKPRISVPFKPQIYGGFTGLSTARSDISLERPEAQPFAAMENLYCSPKGYLSNEPGMAALYPTERGYISHVRQLSAASDVVLYAAREAGGTSLRCVNANAAAPLVWPRDAVVSSAVFSAYPVFAAGQDTLRYYNGHAFKEVKSDAVKGAKYLCAIQNRLVVAGFDGSRMNEIAISRVNDGSIHYTDEAVENASVLKAARLNIQNLIDNADRVRGLAQIETSKLAVFTNQRVLVYQADPDYTKWALDPSVTVRVGTISHRSIVSIGSEVFFCSLSGVHSLRRSMLNGMSVFTTPMSEEITELYQTLVSKVTNLENISAYFSEVDCRLHIFFPVNDLLCYRLSANLKPPSAEQDTTVARWALSTYGGLTCGDYLAGKTVVGSIAGMQSVSPWYSSVGERGPGYADLPVMYHKDLFNPKRSHELVLYASGAGRVLVEAWDETMRPLGNVEFELPDTDQADYHGVPLQRQFTRPFAHQYTGLRLRVRVQSKKSVRIFGVGVLTKE